MPPIILLYALVLLTLAAAMIDRFLRRRRQTVFRRMAQEHQMHYSPGDPLRLTPRVAGHFPIPGAASVRVTDLLYRTDEQSHHYVFTAEYTIGVIGVKHRRRRAASFTESKTSASDMQQIRLGDDGLSLGEQYRKLIAG